MVDSVITITALTVTPGFKRNTLRWTVDLGSCLDYMAPKIYEVYSATSNNRAVATKIADVAERSFDHSPLIIGVTRWYWVRPKDQSNNLGDFFPLSVTGGIAGTPTSTGPGSITDQELADDSVDYRHLRIGAVKADIIDVDKLDAISATLGDVVVNGNLLINGSLTASKYANLSVLRGKLDDGSVTEAITSTSTGGSVIAAQGWNTARTITVDLNSFVAPIGALLDYTYTLGGNPDITVRMIVEYAGEDVVIGDPRTIAPTGSQVRHRVGLSGTLPPLPNGSYVCRMQWMTSLGGGGTLTYNRRTLSASVPQK